MRDRGTKDEAFISKALEMATFNDGRWIANQVTFNSNILNPKTKAALVTSILIYIQKGILEEFAIKEVLNVETTEDVKSFIDKYHHKITEY